MFRRILRLTVAGIGIAASSGDASAQVVRALTATATVPDIGIVTSVATLQWTDPVQGDVSGSVTTKHNGPFLLQVRLTNVHPDTVFAKQTDGTYRVLDAAEWTTIASGAGGATTPTLVSYRIRSTPSSNKTEAPALPLSYRVVAP